MLFLVDLAGSEMVKKTHATGQARTDDFDQQANRLHTHSCAAQCLFGVGHRSHDRHPSILYGGKLVHDHALSSTAVEGRSVKVHRGIDDYEMLSVKRRIVVLYLIIGKI